MGSMTMLVLSADDLVSQGDEALLAFVFKFLVFLCR